MDAGVTGILLAHPLALGSCELKRNKIRYVTSVDAYECRTSPMHQTDDIPNANGQTS